MEMLANRIRLPALGAPGWGGLGYILALVALGYLGPHAFALDPYGLGAARLARPDFHAVQGALLGTDDLGRDILARLVYGARNSLGIGMTVVGISTCVGASLGLAAGVYGRWVDRCIMRLIDAVMTLPSILLAIVIVAVLGAGLANAMLAVTIVAIPRFVRVVRAVAVQEMKKLYVQAAFASGASRFKVLWSEVLPNCWGVIIVQASLGFSDAILEIAALGFLGLGAKPPVAEWGMMLADARPFIESAPYMVVLPGMCIMLTVLAFNLLGDALQDWLDPKARRG